MDIILVYIYLIVFHLVVWYYNKLGQGFIYNFGFSNRHFGSSWENKYVSSCFRKRVLVALIWGHDYCDVTITVLITTDKKHIYKYWSMGYFLFKIASPYCKIRTRLLLCKVWRNGTRSVHAPFIRTFTGQIIL